MSSVVWIISIVLYWIYLLFYILIGLGFDLCLDTCFTNFVARLWIFNSGKSSLLNGLLDEAAVLPTSGSRGCTAAVVELVFHSELTIKATNNDNDNEDAADQSTIPVYRGEVELITLEDWRKE